MTQETVASLHHRAMLAVDAALLARAKRDLHRERAHLREAFALEREAADALIKLDQSEPSRSVLLRSAASLAYDLHELDEAERLAYAAMAGSPPELVKEELRALLQNVSASRHLKVSGVTLQPGEFQMVIEGPAVGHGFIPYELYAERLRTLEIMLFRMGEQLQGRPYRKQGARPKSVTSEVALAISAPRAASFAITLRLGSVGSSLFPEATLATQVVKSFVTNIRLLADKAEAALAESIPQIAYRRNFIANAHTLAPDGELVTGIGFTAPQGLNEPPYMLRRTPDELPQVPPDDHPSSKSPSADKSVTVTGLLLAVDDRSEKGEISLEPEDGGRSVTVKVPEGLDDIVGFMWRKRVTATGYQREGHLELVSIKESE